MTVHLNNVPPSSPHDVVEHSTCANLHCHKIHVWAAEPKVEFNVIARYIGPAAGWGAPDARDNSNRGSTAGTLLAILRIVEGLVNALSPTHCLSWFLFLTVTSGGSGYI